MSLLRTETNPSRRQLTVFGVAWLAFFAVLGAVIHGRGGPVEACAAVWILAVLVPAIGWGAPRFLRMVYVGMSCAAFPFGLAVSLVLLAAVYYLVLTPVGLVLRAFGHDPLGRTFDRRAESYWTPRKPDKGLERSFRQF